MPQNFCDCHQNKILSYAGIFENLKQSFICSSHFEGPEKRKKEQLPLFWVLSVQEKPELIIFEWIWGVVSTSII